MCDFLIQKAIEINSGNCRKFAFSKILLDNAEINFKDISSKGFNISSDNTCLTFLSFGAII